MEAIHRNPSAEDTEEQPQFEPDAHLFRYAEAYHCAIALDDEELIATLRKVLFDCLEVYVRFLDGDPEPRVQMSTWTPFQRTIRFASNYARTYLEHESPAKTAKLIRRDMVEEGRWLPLGVAEWIVDQLTEAERDDTECGSEGTCSRYSE